MILKLIAFRPADVSYVMRRVDIAKAERRPNASFTGQVRQALDESRALRHEIKQPLNAIMLLKELLERQACDAAEAAVHLGRAIDEIQDVIHRYERGRAPSSGSG